MTCYTHLFVMDPLEKLNLKLDTSLRIAEALHQRGHSCWLCTPSDLSVHHKYNERQLQAKARPLQFSSDRTLDIHIGPEQRLDSAQLSAIHLRKDPPFDLAYIATTWMLDRAAQNVRIYNKPASIRSYNEKLLILNYPGDTQPALVSSDPNEILRFIEEQAGGDAIVKPLDLFGGRGIFRVDLAVESRKAALQALNEETMHGQNIRLVQPFNRQIHNGEVRVFTAGGETISWSLKKPIAGSFLANTGAGAIVTEHLPTQKEKAMIDVVAANLLEKGVFFAGFDIIGESISEINITSPRLLLPNDTNSKPFYDKVALLIENDLHKKTEKG